MTHVLQCMRQGRREAPWHKPEDRRVGAYLLNIDRYLPYTAKKCRRHSDTPQAVQGSTSGSLGENLVPRVPVREIWQGSHFAFHRTAAQSSRASIGIMLSQ